MFKKNKATYSDFVRTGGARSGVFDVSDKSTRAYVKQYKNYIPKSSIYKRDRNGSLVPKDRGW